VYFTKTPGIVKPLASDLIWDIKTEKKELFLTFDDGPEPEVTPEILEILHAYKAKATFFCVGKNVAKYPEIYSNILRDGHVTGNHTYSHEKGWETSLLAYLRSVSKCNELVKSNLFRPPYGKIRRNQTAALKKRFQIIMWDVLSADFDQEVDGQKCFSNVVENAKAGSIIVFHDSLKCKQNVLYALPRVLQHFTTEGYQFSAIELPPHT
jgi:peptidoglycan/xylan/chitin deacetylase (PgdA/CDA1 family)